MTSSADENFLGIKPKKVRPARPWNVTLACTVGLIHGITSIALTVAGLILQEQLAFPDPIAPVVRASYLSAVWALFATLVIIPFLWVLTLRGSRHARNAVVVVLFIRILLAGWVLHAFDAGFANVWIAAVFVLDVVGVVMLFGGHKTNTFFAKSAQELPRPPGDYGLDDPAWPIGSLLVGLGLVIGSAFTSGSVLIALTLLGMLIIAWACIYLYASQRGKFVAWQAIVSRLPESPRVADIGCGTGIAAISALRRWPNSNAAAVDDFRSANQSGRGVASLTKNAEEAGVSNRIVIAEDAPYALPLPDDSSNLATCLLTLHHYSAKRKRQIASELVRVAAAGGIIVVLDNRNLAQVADCLSELGCEIVEHRSLGPSTWYGWWGWRLRLVVAAVS